MRSRCLATLAVILTVLISVGCSTQRRLVGRWESVDGPRRTLDLFEDHTFSLRLAKGGLGGLLGNILGPQGGTWQVEAGALVLSRRDEDSGEVTTRRWPINELQRDEVVLKGERWRRGRQAEAATEAN